MHQLSRRASCLLDVASATGNAWSSRSKVLAVGRSAGAAAMASGEVLWCTFSRSSATKART
jgi:hypothetical protein